MNNRTLAMLAGIAALLALVVLVVRQASKSAPASRLVASGFADRADRLDMDGPSGRFSFSRSSSAWNMQAPLAYPADSDAITHLLAQMSEARLSDELSSDPARYSLFGLSDSSATQVRVASSKSEFQPLEFYAGKAGPDDNTAFLRFLGRPGVVQAQGLTASVFTKSMGDWLDKTLCPRLGTVQALDIRDGRSRASLRFENGQWRSAGGRAAVSTSTVAQMLTPAIEALRDLTADRLIPTADVSARETAGLAHPDFTVQVVGAGGVSCALQASKKDSSSQRAVARVGEKRVYFQIYDWRLDPLRKRDLLNLR